jgi:hypothetical protein
MKNKKIRNALISAGIAVMTGVLLLGVNAAIGEAPDYAPPGGAVAPTFTGLTVTGDADIQGEIMNSAGVEHIIINDSLDVLQDIFVKDAWGDVAVLIGDVPSSMKIVEGSLEFFGDGVNDRSIKGLERIEASALGGLVISAGNGKSITLSTDQTAKIRTTGGVLTAVGGLEVSKGLDVISGGVNIDTDTHFAGTTTVTIDGTLDVNEISPTTIDGNLEVDGLLIVNDYIHNNIAGQPLTIQDDLEVLGNTDLNQELASSLFNKNTKGYNLVFTTCPTPEKEIISCGMYFTGGDYTSVYTPGTIPAWGGCVGTFYLDADVPISGSITGVCI